MPDRRCRSMRKAHFLLLAGRRSEGSAHEEGGEGVNYRFRRMVLRRTCSSRRLPGSITRNSTVYEDSHVNLNMFIVRI